MSDLLQWANDPLWDDEPSGQRFIYPVRMSPWLAAREGKRLAIGNPLDETYRRWPFVCAASPQSYIGPYKWAVDFLVPDGTPVVAAADGVVVGIEESFTEWGDDPKFRDTLNYLTIRHDDGTFSQYCHLAQGSVTSCGVELRKSVRCGQEIARVGKTGWTDRDHLHFCAFRNGVQVGPYNFKSLRPRFRPVRLLW